MVVAIHTWSATHRFPIWAISISWATLTLHPRIGHGLYSRLLSERNEYLHDKPKITLANPIEDTTLEILEQQVAKQGGLAVDTYDEVSDIMKREVYEVLSALPMFVYR